MKGDYDSMGSSGRRSNSWFWWSILLLLMAAACLASWLWSFYIIAHPEIPANYRFLKKIKRIDPPKRFKTTDSPKGEFLPVKKLYERYSLMGLAELERENAELLRDYLMNYRETKRPVRYMIGKYDIIESHALGEKDFIPTGVAALSQSEDFSQVLLEQILPAPKESVPRMLEFLTQGGDIRLERSQDLYALLHVERLTDGRMQFSAISLPYAGWKLKSGKGNITLKSPEELGVTLNMENGLPVFHGKPMEEALASYHEYRRKQLAATSDTEALNDVQFIREEDLAPVLSAPVIAPAIEETPKTEPSFSPLKPPGGKPVAAAPPPPRFIPVPPPAVPPPPPKAIIPKAAPPAPVMAEKPPEQPPEPAKPVVPPAVSIAAVTAPPAPAPPVEEAAIPVAKPVLKPFLNTNSPVKKMVGVKEASGMVEKFTPASGAYLTGEFVVTGVVGQRVAMRSRASINNPDADPTKPGSEAALIVLDYPAGVTPPLKDATVSPGAETGLRIRNVVRGKFGQITIVTDQPLE